MMWKKFGVFAGGYFAMGKCKAQHGNGFQKDILGENSCLSRVLLQLWRLQLGLVTAAPQQTVFQEKIGGYVGQGTKSLSHWRMV